ncbi:hypothetical protein J2S40_002627 [Nocardioides luteus]|uniref:Uncharacterized protein n=1 Tax=Nocardioides luteus TaxID=1844 RepID=A0ABQ5T2W2_9ACTN|nr:DUF4919 domain-containing protein [Nocardioides luteus]MDR7311569.1 hypothetical protein [Nocardioides luteus]GGR54703.1 hypothetical protein GCM10010197_21540 [Nocardioides luteus]GLJ70218.1 hypothetical protein GCM10017579_42540 [Nocardioides luteus]
MTTYADLVTAYLDDPGPETLGPLRRAVRNSENFSVDLDLEAVDTFLTDGSYAEAAAALRALMPGAIFSPSAHLRLATALERTGEERSAARERQVASAALRSIRDSGDGTEEHPWTVLRVNDEYDLLRALKKTSDRQELIETGGKRIDRHVCTDGTLAHFDATALV